MSRYASRTTVGVERTRAEIERILSRYGATRFAYAAEPERAQVVFELHHRRIRFLVPLPQRAEFEHIETRYGQRARPAGAVDTAHAAAVRQRWRALALVLKAKLEAVESGIVAFDAEFLAYIMIDGGTTVGDVVVPDLDRALADRKLPPLLPAPDEPRRLRPVKS
jgi:hypothetical protein